MHKIYHYIIYSLLWILTLLPLRILYLFSDFLFLLLYYVFPYRKKVVTNNLKNAFPEKDEREIEKIRFSFFRHFVDFMIESIKSINISNRVLRKRVAYKNLEVIKDQYKKGNNIVFVSGHYGNWEWLSTLALYMDHQLLFAVKRLHSEFSDRMINNLRQKYGGIIVYMEDTYRTAFRKKASGEKIALWLLADQRPPKNAEYWTTFLNQDTAFYLGAAKLVKKLDFSMVFIDIQKKGRGRYEVEFELLAEGNNDLNEYELTGLHVKKLESVIKNRPDYWLWSHKRWKHKKQQ